MHHKLQGHVILSLSIITLGALCLLALFGCTQGGSMRLEEGGQTGDNRGGPVVQPSLNEATIITITGLTTAEDFATSGKFTIGFTAADASGTPIFALTKDSSGKALVFKQAGGWVTYKAQTVATCTASTPSGTTCSMAGNITSRRPTGGSGNVGAVVLIDDSGSMMGTDPNDSRRPAASAFVDSVCESASNMFGVFDYGVGLNHSFNVTRDILTAESVINGTAFSGTLPYIPCATANVTAANTAIQNQVISFGGTPLYDSVKELCEHVVQATAEGGTLKGKSLGMLLLSDGLPNDAIAKQAAEDCIRDNSINMSTVGLGPASELDALSSPGAVSVLKELATAGGGIYSAATDASALQPIFDALGTAITQGQNFATFVMNPIPPSGTAFSGTVTVGSQTATFSGVAP